MADNLVFGPGGNVFLKLTEELSDLLRSHARYLSNLPIWDQYLVWRYTLGSGAITKKLVTGKPDENDVGWTYYFFNSYNTDHYGSGNIGYPYQRYQRYFENPKSYLGLPKPKQDDIAKFIIRRYVEDLERIILNAPPTPGEITVFKASGPYPGLPIDTPSGKLFNNGLNVYQKPFNSTTYDPEFNFYPFLGPNKCCLHQIIIPACSRVLAITPPFHAYPHERELLLPFGSTFEITSIDKILVNMIPPENQTYIKIQKSPYVIGEVYRIDPKASYDPETYEVRLFTSNAKIPHKSCN